MKKNKVKNILIYSITFVFFGGLDCYSTHILSKNQIGNEANPVLASTDLSSLFRDHAIMLAIGLFCLLLAMKLKKGLEINDPTNRSVSSFLSLMRSSRQNRLSFILLLDSLLLLWIKFVGSGSNLLLIYTGKELFSSLRPIFPNTSNTCYFWIWALGSNFLGLLFFGFLVYKYWERNGTIISECNS